MLILSQAKFIEPNTKAAKIAAEFFKSHFLYLRYAASLVGCRLACAAALCSNHRATHSLSLPFQLA